ncbi:MAG: hypothetical protein OXF93_24560 [Acidobacteria bacterium]|nr:hypothetical protein [Acidobacteriota bacterium]
MIAALERWALVPRVERWFFNAMHAVITLSGVAYFCMKYLMATDDPFALINHPWEPAMLSIHVMAAPLVVVFFGMAFRSHTLRKLLQASPVNRRSGLASAGAFLVMTLSGYLIQVATSPALIATAIWTHVVTSVLFVIAYGVHMVIGYRAA